MSASNIITATVDLARGVQLHRLGRLFASGDKAAHTISVTVLQDGAAADLSGQTVKGYFIRADDATVTFDGTLSGNVASVTLPNSCYAVAGHFQIIVKALSTNVNTAIFWGDGAVTRSSTDIIVDPDHIVPSLEELLAMLDDMEAAAEAANDAADAADTAAGSANSAATSASTAAASATTAASAASAAAQQVTDAIIPDLSDVTTNTLAAGQNASVVIDTDDEGTPHNPKVTFNIPRGADGSGAVSSVDGIQPVSGNVTLPVFAGTNGSAAGAAGKVPAPATTDAGKFLKADGTWATPPGSAGVVETVSGVGVATGTTNIPLTGEDVPMSDQDNTSVADAIRNAEFDPLLCYPVGAIYISVAETSPSMLFGGTWERLEGRFLLAATIGGTAGTNIQGDQFVAPGGTGGEATHTLTVSEMPSHTHNVRRTSASGSGSTNNLATDAKQSSLTDNGYGPFATGGGGAHNNMPPFLAVYMWKRLS